MFLKNLFFKDVPLLPISRNFLQTPSLDDTLLGNFTLSNSVVLVEDLRPYFLTKYSLQSPLTHPSYMPQQFFISLLLRSIIPAIYTKNFFPTSSI